MVRVAGRTVRTVEIARAGWGAVLLCGPQRVLGAVDRADVDTRSVVVARVLGARQLIQAVLSGMAPSPTVLAMGVWVDGVHALTAAGLATADRRRARAALVDAVIAASWALIGRRDLTRGRVPRPAHDRRRDLLAQWALQLLPAGAGLADTAARRCTPTGPPDTGAQRDAAPQTRNND